MLCPSCGTENAEDALVCVACREVLDPDLADAFDDETDDNLQTNPEGVRARAAPIPSDDDWAVASHTRANPLGDVRPANEAELAKDDVMLRADAVLALKDGADTSAFSPFEQHVASHLDGNRTVARIRKRTELSGDDVRIALGMLRDKGALELRGIFDPTMPVPAAEPGAAPQAAPAPVLDDDDLGADVATAPGMNLRDIEAAHGPLDVAHTDPAVPKELLDELRDHPSPFDKDGDGDGDD